VRSGRLFGVAAILAGLTTSSFYVASSARLNDFPKAFFGLLAIPSLPGVFAGMVFVGGARGSVHGGGDLWAVSLVAFLINALGYFIVAIGVNTIVQKSIRSSKP
jgi:hypothetical protein